MSGSDTVQLEICRAAAKHERDVMRDIACQSQDRAMELQSRIDSAEAERTRYLGLINAALAVLESPGSGARSLMEVYMILNQVRHG